MKCFLFSILALVALSVSVAAQQPSYPMSCAGADPSWSLVLDDGKAEFDFRRQSEMDIMLDTPAQGSEWPRALTLIGRGDSAILILENRACENRNITARILTQRGETPILLTGCCEMAEN